MAIVLVLICGAGLIAALCAWIARLAAQQPAPRQTDPQCGASLAAHEIIAEVYAARLNARH